MSVKRVIEGMHIVPMGMANAFLIEGDDGSVAAQVCTFRWCGCRRSTTRSSKVSSPT